MHRLAQDLVALHGGNGVILEDVVAEILAIGGRIALGNIERPNTPLQQPLEVRLANRLFPLPIPGARVRLPPLPQATWLPWKPCCRIAGWPPTLSIGWNSGRKNPVKSRPVVVGNGPHVASPSPSRSC